MSKRQEQTVHRRENIFGKETHEKKSNIKKKKKRRSSTSLAIKEVQVKTPVRFHYYDIVIYRKNTYLISIHSSWLTI